MYTHACVCLRVFVCVCIQRRMYFPDKKKSAYNFDNNNSNSNNIVLLLCVQVFF